MNTWLQTQGKKKHSSRQDLFPVCHGTQLKTNPGQRTGRLPSASAALWAAGLAPGPCRSCPRTGPSRRGPPPGTPATPGLESLSCENPGPAVKGLGVSLGSCVALGGRLASLGLGALTFNRSRLHPTCQPPANTDTSCLILTKHRELRHITPSFSGGACSAVIQLMSDRAGSRPGTFLPLRPSFPSPPALCSSAICFLPPSSH